MARRNAGRCRKYDSSRLRTMIPMVVTPPSMAARVSLCASCSNESSLPMWTCGSKIPGSTTLPPASSTSCADPESFSPMAAMRLPQMPTSAATVPTPEMTSVPLRTTRSKRGLTTGSRGHGGGRSPDLARRLSGPALERMRERADLMKTEQPRDLGYMQPAVIEVTNCQIAPQLLKYFGEVQPFVREPSCKRPLAHSQTAGNVFHARLSMRKHRRDRVLDPRTQLAHVASAIG